MAEATTGKSTYYKAAAALLLLFILTVVAWLLPLGSLSVVVAMTIAFAKALVIALFFMHVRYSSRLTMLVAAAGLYWLLIMFALTFSDYVTRF